MTNILFNFSSARYFIFLVGMLFAIQISAFGQPEEAIFLSKEFNPDVYQMKEASEFRYGDPIYLALRLARNSKVTVGQLRSRKTREAQPNIHICVEIPAGDTATNCYEALPESVDPEVLNRNYFVYTLVPDTNDVNVPNGYAVRTTLSKLGELTAADPSFRVSLLNQENGKSISARGAIDTVGKKNSRYTAYLRALEDADQAKLKKEQLAETATQTVPVSFMNDPAAEKEVLARVQDHFGNNFKVYKVVFNQQQWGNEANQYGIVAGRGAHIKMMWKNLTTGDCFVHWGMYAWQDHFGGGKFSPISLRWRYGGGDQWTYFDCAKFTGLK